MDVEFSFFLLDSLDLHPIETYGANRKTKIRDLLPSVASLSDALDLAVLSMSI
ncbi:MAG: hypothetical protein LBC45_06185 [Chlamydiales bacterium]|nr:hypothetical protein [Chlamydiales bacterium]